MKLVNADHPRTGAGVNAVHSQLMRLAYALRTRPATSPDPERSSLALVSVLGLTVLVNLMALVLPVITLAIFDYVARDGAQVSLALLCGAGGLAVTHEMTMRRTRRAILCAQGANIVSIVAGRQFRHAIGGATLRTGKPFEQVAAFRELRRLRAILASALSTALLDAPFCALFIGILFAVGGAMGAPALVAVVAHLAFAALVRPRIRDVLQRGAGERERLRVALSETASKATSLDEIGMRPAWAARVEGLAVSVAMRRERESIAEALLEAASHLITALAIIAALWLGAREVMSGMLTIGGVVAAVMLTWRSIAPFEHVLQSPAEIRSSLAIAQEALAVRRETPQSPLPAAELSGRIEVRGLSVKIEGTASPVLRNVSFDVAAGEMVAVCGASGAGKTALLCTLMGLRPADAGAVALDGRDIRSLSPDSLRMQLGYAPQRPTLFHGTVAQNIRLLAPAAEEKTIRRALELAGVALPHPQLPQGLDTRLNSGGGGQIDEGLRMKLMLAGIYAKQPKILLLDDPGANLDRDGDGRLLETLQEMRGAVTIILVTNRPSHMRVCDRIIRLDHGMIVTDGRVEQVLAG